MLMVGNGFQPETDERRFESEPPERYYGPSIRYGVV